MSESLIQQGDRVQERNLLTKVNELEKEIERLRKELMIRTMDRDDWREIARKLLKEKHVPE